MSERVLVVDDDAPVRRMLTRTLGAEGNEVVAVADGGQALDFDERLRSKGVTAPILLLTARDAVPDRVSGLDAGADDYLVKPFAVEELSARVRALTRRGLAAGDQLVFADLTLDPTTRVVVRGGREIELTEREAALLELLIRHGRTVVSRDMAIERVWDTAPVGANVVDRYVGYLRRKLGPPQLIHTVRGVGFTLRP